MIEDTILQYDLDPAYTAAQALALRDQWWNERGARIWEGRQPHANHRDPERRLRVGYVSGDWNFHSAALAFAPVVLHHSAQFDVFGYNTTAPQERDASTNELKRRLGARLVDVQGYTAKALAQIIRTDKIDILIDCSGLTPGHRFDTFAAQPAPIQLQGWGYVTDSGWPCFTGILADRYVAPMEMRSAMRSRVVDLPCVLTQWPRPGLPASSPLPCLTKPPVFGVFQRAQKINRKTCRIWSRILSAVPDAMLLIKSSQEPEDFRRDTLAMFTAHVRARVRFEAATPNREHLLRHHAVDLVLDTWPQTGGCSTLEAIWMGVPILTLASDRLIQRTTGSVLHTLGLDAWIADSEDAYVAKAVAAVTMGRDELAALRVWLRQQLIASPILHGYVTAVETVYRQLWREYCAVSVKDAA